MQWKKNQSDLQENVSVRVPFFICMFFVALGLYGRYGTNKLQNLRYGGCC